MRMSRTSHFGSKSILIVELVTQKGSKKAKVSLPHEALTDGQDRSRQAPT